MIDKLLICSVQALALNINDAPLYAIEMVLKTCISTTGVVAIQF